MHIMGLKLKAQRNNFKIGPEALCQKKSSRPLPILKKAAALANTKLGVLPAKEKMGTYWPGL